jgi:hypothetical protein
LYERCDAMRCDDVDVAFLFIALFCYSFFLSFFVFPRLISRYGPPGTGKTMLAKVRRDDWLYDV